ncbi:hypothetical protein PPERSA_13027 [Pseudocohnilembus persalinus]|uniref:Uncharacterized protein n=1 Tax=Pseudocohnilembus persalinus TaxID=266149 RepID=A0A0V0R1Y6_PSEPJ|nr:hypothetical protein PPERSA_13027 [Pseudocohnilembus persalinus]|eukprot:KRX08546.1 hypothetical protein PPERSA_13027 [Pseudocohnilembus persalinus]
MNNQKENGNGSINKSQDNSNNQATKRKLIQSQLSCNDYSQQISHMQNNGYYSDDNEYSNNQKCYQYKNMNINKINNKYPQINENRINDSNNDNFQIQTNLQYNSQNQQKQEMYNSKISKISKSFNAYSGKQSQSMLKQRESVISLQKNREIQDVDLLEWSQFMKRASGNQINLINSSSKATFLYNTDDSKLNKKQINRTIQQNQNAGDEQSQLSASKNQKNTIQQLSPLKNIDMINRLNNLNNQSTPKNLQTRQKNRTIGGNNSENKIIFNQSYNDLKKPEIYENHLSSSSYKFRQSQNLLSSWKKKKVSPLGNSYQFIQKNQKQSIKNRKQFEKGSYLSSIKEYSKNFPKQNSKEDSFIPSSGSLKLQKTFIQVPQAEGEEIDQSLIIKNYDSINISQSQGLNLFSFNNQVFNEKENQNQSKQSMKQQKDVVQLNYLNDPGISGHFTGKQEQQFISSDKKLKSSKKNLDQSFGSQSQVLNSSGSNNDNQQQSNNLNQNSKNKCTQIKNNQQHLTPQAKRIDTPECDTQQNLENLQFQVENDILNY